MEPVVVLLHSDLGEHLLDEVLVGLGAWFPWLFFLPSIVPDESDVGAPTMYAFLMTRAQILHRSSFSFFENPGSSASTCFKDLVLLRAFLQDYSQRTTQITFFGSRVLEKQVQNNLPMLIVKQNRVLLFSPQGQGILKETQFRKIKFYPQKEGISIATIISLHFRHFPLVFLPGAWYNKVVIPQTLHQQHRERPETIWKKG